VSHEGRPGLLCEQVGGGRRPSLLHFAAPSRPARLAHSSCPPPPAPRALLPCSLQDELADEHAKRAKWADENIRRRHSYIPFMFAMLRHLADQGSLGPLIEKARSSKGKEQQLQQQ